MRKHALAARELLQQVRKVLLKFGSYGESVGDVVNDIQRAVAAGDVQMTQALFDRVKQWVDVLKSDSVNMQDQCSKVVMELQSSIEQARSVLASTASPPSISSSNSIGHTKSSSSTELVVPSFIAPASQGSPSMPTLPSLSPLLRTPTPISPAESAHVFDMLFNPAVIAGSGDKLSSALHWFAMTESTTVSPPAMSSAAPPAPLLSDRVVPYVSPELGPSGAPVAGAAASASSVHPSGAADALPELRLHVDTGGDGCAYDVDTTLSVSVRAVV